MSKEYYSEERRLRQRFREGMEVVATRAFLSIKQGTTGKIVEIKKPGAGLRTSDVIIVRFEGFPETFSMKPGEISSEHDKGQDTPSLGLRIDYL